MANRKRVKPKKELPRLRVGRKMGLTEYVLREVTKRFELGMKDSHIFTSMNIAQSSWHEWKKRGAELAELQDLGQLPSPRSIEERDEWQLLIRFHLAAERGRAIAITRNWTWVQKHAKNLLGAAKWSLQILDKETFGEPDELPLKHKADLDFEAIQRKLRALKGETEDEE